MSEYSEADFGITLSIRITLALGITLRLTFFLIIFIPLILFIDLIFLVSLITSIPLTIFKQLILKPFHKTKRERERINFQMLT